MPSYDVEITYTGTTEEKIHVDDKMVLTWEIVPFPARVDMKRRKLVAIECICAYLKANGGVKLEIKEQP